MLVPDFLPQQEKHKVPADLASVQAPGLKKRLGCVVTKRHPWSPAEGPPAACPDMALKGFLTLEIATNQEPIQLFFLSVIP